MKNRSHRYDINRPTITAKICGQKNNFLSNRPKTTNSLPSPLFSMLYGWGFAPAFLTSPKLSNGWKGRDFRAEEFLLWSKDYCRDCRSRHETNIVNIKSVSV